MAAPDFEPQPQQPPPATPAGDAPRASAPPAEAATLPPSTPTEPAPGGTLAADPARPGSATVDLEPSGSKPGESNTEACPPPENPIPPELLQHPRYRILGPLGAGGMGCVYKAEHRLMERLVAIKLIRRGLTGDQGAAERFRREVRAAARLSHPNIVTAFDAEEAGGLHFLVMEFVEGDSLDRLLASRKQLAVAETCDCVRQAALGLQYAHERGMVHRDIKPQNLLRTPDGVIKILDFGLARFVSESGTGGGITHSGVVMGTPDYVAPEQANDARRADIRADIYGLGCTLYHLLTGRVPFPGGSLFQKLMAHHEAIPEPVTAFRADVPPGLVAVLERMMAKDLAERYQTPREVAHDLAPFLDASAATLAPQGAPPATPSEPTEFVMTPTPRPVPRGGERRAPATGHTADTEAVWATPAVDEGVQAAPSRRPPAKGGSKRTPGMASRRTREPGSRPVNGVAIGSIILGVGSLVIALVPCFGFISLPFSVVGLILGLVAVTTSLVGKRHGLKQPILGVVLNALALAAVPVGFLLVKNSAESWFASNINPGYTRSAFNPNPLGQPGSTGKGLPETAREVRRYEGHDAPVHVVAFSPDGKRLVSGSRDGTIRIWDTNTGQELRRLEGHRGTVLCLAQTLDGHRVLSGGSDRTARFWDTDTGEELRRLDGHGDAVQSIALSTNGLRALTGCGTQEPSVRLWDLQAGGPPRRFPGNAAGVLALDFDPNGQQFSIGTGNALVHIWDSLGSELRTCHMNAGSPITFLVLSANGDRAYYTGGGDAVAIHDLVRDVAVARMFTELPMTTPNIQCLAVSPSGHYALSGTADGEVLLWDCQQKKPLHRFHGHIRAVRSVAFSSNGLQFVSGGDDTTVRVWDLKGMVVKP